MRNLTDLTICTVSYKSEELLNLNRKLLCQLNPGMDIKWFVVNNTLFDNPQHIGALDPGFTQLPCVPRPEKIYGQDSYHQGLGLNSCRKHIDTRYVLVLDPDFFILMKDALADVLSYMNSNRLAFFGVPWHPMYFEKYRDFPCPHCMFIDTSLVAIQNLDFAPVYETAKLADRQDLPDWDLWRRSAPLLKLCQKIDAILTRFNKQKIFRIKKRSRIGTSLDTGARIFLAFVTNPTIQREILEPLWHQSQDSKPKGLLDALAEAMDGLMPRHARFQYLNYSLCKSLFGDLEDFPAPEEFSWRNSYFGFHIRQYPRSIAGREYMAKYIADFVRARCFSDGPGTSEQLARHG